MAQTHIDQKARAMGLTRRQTEVLECVAIRLTLKETASRLAVSESAVNAHIKALKRQLGVNSLSELAEEWRKLENLHEGPTCRNSGCTNSRLADDQSAEPSPTQDEIGQILTFSEPVSFHQSVPWAQKNAEIVPGVLRGAKGKLNRVLAILLIAIGTLALVMLGLGVGQGINAALSAREDASPKRI